MKNWLKILLINPLSALFLGMSLTLAFAPYEVFPLAAIAPAGLLFLWLNTTPKQAFWLGLIFGFGFFGSGVYWIYHSIHVIGEVPILFSLVITGVFLLILALYPALTGLVLNRYFPVNQSFKIICAFPALWVLSEWARSWLFTGFPWFFLGYSQTNSPLAGYAPILSVFGVSLALLLTSSLIVNAYYTLKQKDYRALYLSLLAIILIWAGGELLNLIPWTEAVGKPIPISLVQGNIPQTIKWSPEHLQLSLSRYEELTNSLWQKGKIIIWPEAAVPLPLQNAEDYINMMDAKAKKNDTHLILGIPIQTADKKNFYNAIVTLGDDKEVYLKRRLVPFGEFIPFSDTFEQLFQFMNLPYSVSIPGNLKQSPLSFGNIRILPSICYEIGFPELMWSGDKTISFLLTVTNDGWYGDSPAQAQHLQMAQMRAIEFRRPLLFVSNDGITAIIDKDGRINASLPQRQVGVLNGNIQPVYGLTPWMRNGIDFILFIAIGLLALAIRANIIRKRELQLDPKMTSDGETQNVNNK